MKKTMWAKELSGNGFQETSQLKSRGMAKLHYPANTKIFDSNIEQIFRDKISLTLFFLKCSEISSVILSAPDLRRRRFESNMIINFWKYVEVNEAALIKLYIHSDHIIVYCLFCQNFCKCYSISQSLSNKFINWIEAKWMKQPLWRIMNFMEAETLRRAWTSWLTLKMSATTSS